MKNTDLVAACLNIAEHYKTLYVMGCFGAPLNQANKERYCKNHIYNKQFTRTQMIQAAAADTFGFDCVNLIKGVLWGWSGDTGATYGGAKYMANGVPDIGADSMIRLCKDLSTDFTDVLPGEALWTPGHIGVYIGNGKAVECTPSWRNCVQITTVHNITGKNGYAARPWVKHGKLPWVDYAQAEQPAAAHTEADLDRLAREVLAGKWGNGAERKARLAAAGYNYGAIQARVNELLK